MSAREPPTGRMSGPNGVCRATRHSSSARRSLTLGVQPARPGLPGTPTIPITIPKGPSSNGSRRRRSSSASGSTWSTTSRAVDPWFWGSGSKVIHNVVSGVGGDGSAVTATSSPGCPSRPSTTARLHHDEPMRLLTVIEAPVARISSVIGQARAASRLVPQPVAEPAGAWIPRPLSTTAVGPTARGKPCHRTVR